MKEFFKNINNELETMYGGIFGVIAILAVFVEMAIAEFDSAAIASGIKDIFGILITVVMLVVAIRAIEKKPKIRGEFLPAFHNEMEAITERYSPIINKDPEIDTRYNIAASIDGLYDNSQTEAHALFDIENSKIHFYVRKLFFMGVSKEDFKPRQDVITKTIAQRITQKHTIIKDQWKSKSDGFEFEFSKSLTAADAKEVAQMVDNVILLYIAENKK